MSHIFISYSTQNSEYAYQLANKLREEGFDIWIDNSELRSSDNWWESIVRALRGCAAFIVIMTPEARQSKWVQREVTLADKWQKPSFPLLLAGDGDDWEIYVLTQYESVKIEPNPNKPPQYAGNLPRPVFYDKLAQYSHRKRRDKGENVVHQSLVTLPDEESNEVSEEIANPPLETATPPPQPIIESISHEGSEVSPEVATPLLEMPPLEVITPNFPPAKSELKQIGSTTQRKKPPGTSPKHPAPDNYKRILFLLVLGSILTLVLCVSLFTVLPMILGQPTEVVDLPTLIVLPTASSSCQALAQTPPANANQIAFTSNRDGNYEIYLMNADGTGLCRLTDYFSSDISPSWSPDGRQIAFVSFRDGNAEIYSMNVDGSNPVRLTTNSGSDYDPVWSPDGNRIAFASTRAGSSDIYVINTNGTDLRRITASSSTDYSPTWSPDSSEIAFTSYLDGDAEIYRMVVKSLSLTQVTRNSLGDFSPAWSSDGHQIAFRSYGNGNQEIYVMNVDGTGLRRITANPATDDAPAWSPNGRQIAFESQRDGNFEIYVMNSNGDNEQNITNNAADDKNPAWRPVPKI